MTDEQKVDGKVEEVIGRRMFLETLTGASLGALAAGAFVDLSRNGQLAVAELKEERK